MANLIGDLKNNSLIGTEEPDIIFGDPLTTGAAAGGFPGIPNLGVLTAGKSGNDTIRGLGSNDSLFGDAWEITDTGKGGNDTLDGGAGENALYGDAFTMSGTGKGGNDTFLGGTGANVFIGDALTMSGASVGGNDTFLGGAGDSDIFELAILGDATVMSGSARVAMTGLRVVRMTRTSSAMRMLCWTDRWAATTRLRAVGGATDLPAMPSRCPAQQ
jgi:serralysin